MDDLALSLTYPSNRRVPEADIGFVLMPDWNNLDRMSSITAQIVGECSAVLNKNCKVRFISFYNEHDHDIKMYEAIAQKAGLSDYDIIDTVFTPEDVASAICSCNLIVSMRYHATLLSAVLGMKTLCINYGKVHPHYENKIQYIREHYCNTLCIADYEHIEPELIRKAMTTELAPYPIEHLDQIRKSTKPLFDEVCKRILEHRMD